jgi:hypothetical protein
MGKNEAYTSPCMAVLLIEEDPSLLLRMAKAYIPNFTSP